MTTADEGIEYTELFRVIEEYAQGDHFHQVKALRLIADNFTPFGNLPREPTRNVVSDIFRRNNYLIWAGGRPSLVGLEAIVAVARWGDYIGWGLDLFLKVLDAAVHNRDTAVTKSGADPQPKWLVAAIVDDVSTVLRALESLGS